MARARKGKAKTGSVKVNFKGVESRQTPPEGDYVVEILEAQMGESKSTKADMIEFTLEIAKGKYKGVKLYLYCTLDEKSLWKLHAFLTALGVEIPDDEMDIDLSDLVGEQCVGVVTHETYNGKKRAKMTDFDSLENYSGDDADDEDEDEDDEPKKGKKSSKKDAGKGKSKKSSKDDDDEDEDEDEDEEKSSKKSKSKAGAKGKKSSKDDDDEDEDDDEPKKGKSKKSSKKPKKIDRDDVEEMDEEELQELIDEHDLDVDLDDHKKLAKKVAAVIDALEEEDLLDD